MVEILSWTCWCVDRYRHG